MLGINSKRELIKGEFAQKVKEAAWRAATRNYNTEDLENIAWEKETAEKGEALCGCFALCTL